MVDIFSKVNSGYTEKLPDLNYEIVFNPYIHIYIYIFSKSFNLMWFLERLDVKRNLLDNK